MCLPVPHCCPLTVLHASLTPVPASSILLSASTSWHCEHWAGLCGCLTDKQNPVTLANIFASLFGA